VCWPGGVCQPHEPTEHRRKRVHSKKVERGRSIGRAQIIQNVRTIGVRSPKPRLRTSSDLGCSFRKNRQKASANEWERKIESLQTESRPGPPFVLETHPVSRQLAAESNSELRASSQNEARGRVCRARCTPPEYRNLLRRARDCHGRQYTT